MPCGFSFAAAHTDANRYRAALRAVAPRAISAGRAFVVDASAHFSRPGPRVADGVELLAALLHPAAFPAAALAGTAAVWT
jgi:iron complex transport system substrate-binding protein